MPSEILALRNENSKTFALDNGHRQLVVSIGAIHYKDNYADKSEQWKDIDLTWVDNKITKAPYELTRDGNKYTIRDKKSGEVSTIELSSVQPAGMKFEVLPERGAIRFRHTLPSDKVPFQAQFKVTGKIPFLTQASDDDGELGLETTLVDGVLTEKLSDIKDKGTGKIRPAKGQIKVDPTWQVGASTDDTKVYWNGSAWAINNTDGYQMAGYDTSSDAKMGGGMRFLNVTVPSGATVIAAYLIMTCGIARTETTVNSVIIGEDVDDAATFSTIANYQGRRGTIVGGANDNNITTASVTWNNIGSWSVDTEYNSPEIKTIVQEIIDRGGWASGQDMVIFWDDHAGNSTSGAQVRRLAYAYDTSTTYAPKLVITYTAVYEVSCSDALAVGDSNVGALLLYLTATDAFASGETPASQANVNSLSVDALADGDTSTIIKIFTDTLTDSIDIGDLLVDYITLNLSASEGMTLDDLTTIEKVLALTAIGLSMWNRNFEATLFDRNQPTSLFDRTEIVQMKGK